MFIPSENAELYVEERGKGEPLLLIAGLASDSQSWQTMLPALAESYRVIVFDNRCVGRTKSADDQRLTIEQMAQDATAVLDGLGIESAHVLGHSMGGMIALQMAADFPARVRSLIVLAAPLQINQRNRMMLRDWTRTYGASRNRALWYRNLYYWILSPAFFENTQAVDDAVQMSMKYPYQPTPMGFALQVCAAHDFDAKECCDKIRTRTMVMAGEFDLIFPPEDCLMLSDAIPGASLQVVAGAAHSIHLEKAEAVVQLIREFLG